MSTSIIEKISALLAVAERTDNEAEAEAFIAKAQALATNHAVDLAVARQHRQRSLRREEPVIRRVTLSTRQQRNKADRVNLFLAITRANDLKANIAADSTFVELFGFPSDIEVAEALYSSLYLQMVDSCNREMSKKEYREVEVPYEVLDEYWGGTKTVFKPMDGRTFRRSFYEGFVARIGWRLAEAKREAERGLDERVVQVLDAQDNEVSTSAALVLVGKQEEVSAFYAKASNARGSWRGSSSQTHGFGRERGDEAGSKARLSGQRAISGAKGALAG